MKLKRLREIIIAAWMLSVLAVYVLWVIIPKIMGRI